MMTGLDRKFRGKLTTWKLVLGLLVIVLGVGAAVWFDGPAALRRLLAWISGLGFWAPALFVLIYVLACVLFVPGFVLTLGAGAVFGFFRGVIIASAGATLGAVAAFLLGRYLARDLIAKKIEDHPKFKSIDEAIGREGWKIVGLVRLSPIFPFNLLNYAFGLTRVSLRDYVFASWIGMLPATMLYVYLGSVAGELARAASGERSRGPAEWILYSLGLLATVIVTLYIARLARQALQRRIPG